MKSLEEFVELFAEQFDETDASEITADKNFRELVEWSVSYTHLTLPTICSV